MIVVNSKRKFCQIYKSEAFVYSFQRSEESIRRDVAFSKSQTSNLLCQ
jgi:hypothetical protein